MWSGWCHASCTCGWEITIIFFYACTAVAITISGWLSYDFDLCYSAMLCFGFNFFASPKWNEEQEKYEEKKKESAFWNVAADVRVVSQSHLESKIERLFSRCFFFLVRLRGPVRLTHNWNTSWTQSRSMKLYESAANTDRCNQSARLDSCFLTHTIRIILWDLATCSQFTPRNIHNNMRDHVHKSTLHSCKNTTRIRRK